MLPMGWVEAQIGELCTLVNGRAFKPSDWSRTGLPIIRIQNLNRRDAEFNFCTGEVKSKFIVEPGELLFAWSGTPGTSFGAHVWNGSRAVLNQHIFRVMYNRSALSKRFFQKAINSKLDELIGNAHGGVGLAHVTKGKFEATRVPLPPLAEQRRIVAKLDALTARLARARAELERVSVLARQFRNASLSAARKSTVSYPTQTVSQLVSASFDGPFGSSLKSADYEQEGAQVVRIENIGHLLFRGEKRTFIPLQKYSGLIRHTLVPGDILFASFVDQEVRICRFPGGLKGPAINKADCFVLRIDESKCNPEFLVYLLAAPETYRDMRKAVHGATRPRIGLSQLRAYPVHIPSLKQQCSTVERIRSRFSRADSLEAEATRAKALLDRLEAAILAKAFRGELVPQDPADEPASVLLDRIRAERSATPKAKRGRRAAAQGER